MRQDGEDVWAILQSLLRGLVIQDSDQRLRPFPQCRNAPPAQEEKVLTQDVDEFRTSKTCNACLGELRRYRKRGGRLSHSRLFCPTCSSRMGRPFFVDRDVNAATNILRAGGTSPSRPEALSRGNSRISTASLERGEKSKSEDAKERERNKLHVDAGRLSSSPSPDTLSEVYTEESPQKQLQQ